MIYAIGDIHGQNVMLQAALAHLEETLLKPTDTVVFLGDYIDRGDDSKGVFDTLRAFRERHSDTVFLRGNHEELFLNAYDGIDDDEYLWLINGGVETIRSYGTEWESSWHELIPPEDLTFVRDTEMEYVGRHFRFVHAGLPPTNITIQSSFKREPRLWIREEFIDSDFNFGQVVVFGHTPQRSMKPLVMANKVGLDTAAVFGGRLSVAGFDDSLPVDGMPKFDLFQINPLGKIVGKSHGAAPEKAKTAAKPNAKSPKSAKPPVAKKTTPKAAATKKPRTRKKK